MNILVERCLVAYEASSIRGLANELGIPPATLQTWSDVKLSSIGKLLLESLLKVKELEKDVEIVNNFTFLLEKRNRI